MPFVVLDLILLQIPSDFMCGWLQRESDLSEEEIIGYCKFEIEFFDEIFQDIL